MRVRRWQVARVGSSCLFPAGNRSQGRRIRLLNCAAVQLCSCTTMQLCNYAAVQLCDCATGQLCNCACCLQSGLCPKVAAPHRRRPWPPLHPPTLSPAFTLSPALLLSEEEEGETDWNDASADLSLLTRHFLSVPPFCFCCLLRRLPAVDGWRVASPLKEAATPPLLPPRSGGCCSPIRPNEQSQASSSSSSVGGPVLRAGMGLFWISAKAVCSPVSDWQLSSTTPNAPGRFSLSTWLPACEPAPSKSRELLGRGEAIASVRQLRRRRDL